MQLPGWGGPGPWAPGPSARPSPPGPAPAGGAPPAGADPLARAPQLPVGLSSRPAWTTVPGAPGAIAQGQLWTAETWARVRDLLGRFAPVTTAPAAPGTSGVQGYVDGANFAQRVVDLTNRERSIRGLPPLAGRFGLRYVAEMRSADMIRRRYFDHVDPDGRDPFWQLRANGVTYRTAGENIAYGQRTPEAVVAAWMASPGHRANILNPRFGHLGVGAVQNTQSGQIYWTQLFSD